MPESPMTIDDESLARQARAGDSAALEALARRWQVPLVAFLQRRVGSRADAEDLFQETFVRVCQHLQDYDDRRSFKTWVLTIAWRLAANHLRDRRRFAGPDALEATHSDVPTPLANAQSSDLHQGLWAVAREVLSEEHYAMLWMCYVEQLSPREIAQISGKSWVAVRTAMHRARKMLAPHVSQLERIES